MIIVTGAAGFIGSVVAAELNQKGYNDLILVDDFSKKEKERNYIDLKYKTLVDRNVFFDWFKENHEEVDFVVHLGARTDTTEFEWIQAFDKGLQKAYEEAQRLEGCESVLFCYVLL